MAFFSCSRSRESLFTSRVPSYQVQQTHYEYRTCIEHTVAMHPLVRDLYKRALVVGRDYPLGMDYVRRTWKKAIRNPNNCPSCYYDGNEDTTRGGSRRIVLESPRCEKELRKAVARGRFMVREMIGVIQLKKYRTLKRRYDNDSTTGSRRITEYLPLLIQNLDNPSKDT